VLVQQSPMEPFNAAAADALLADVRASVTEHASRPAAEFVGFHADGNVVVYALNAVGLSNGFLLGLVHSYVQHGDAVHNHAAAAACDVLLRRGAFRRRRSVLAKLLLECGRAFAGTRRTLDALSSARMSIHVDAGSATLPAARIFLGWLLDHTLGQKAAAEEQYQLAISALPNHCVAYINLGWIYTDSGLQEQALAVLTAAYTQSIARRRAPSLPLLQRLDGGSGVRIVLPRGMQTDADEQAALQQGEACGGSYAEKLSWNLGQAMMERRTLTAVLQGRAWLRRQLCDDPALLSEALQPHTDALCAGLLAGVGSFLDALADALAAAGLVAMPQLRAVHATAAAPAPAAGAAQAQPPPPGPRLERMVSGGSYGRSWSAGQVTQPPPAAAVAPAAADDGPAAMPVSLFAALGQVRTASTPARRARRQLAYAWLEGRSPGVGWQMLGSVVATPQIMPANSADIRQWRLSTQQGLAELLEATSRPAGAARGTLAAVDGSLTVGAPAPGASSASPGAGAALASEAGPCIRLGEAHAGVPDLPFAWHYHGYDDDAPLQQAFSDLLRCNFGAYVSPLLEPDVLAPRAAQLAAWRASHPAEAQLHADVFSAGLERAAGRHTTRRPMRVSEALDVPFPFASPLRVGFISKYFTLNHPHSQLLTGVLRRLDRSRFEPFLLRIVNSDRGYFVDPDVEHALVCGFVQQQQQQRWRGAWSPRGGSAGHASTSHGAAAQDSVEEAGRSPAWLRAGEDRTCEVDPAERRRLLAEYAITVPHNLTAARAGIEALRLDVLLFADHMSEGLSHSLGFARLAAAQAQYWGNPVTTGKAGTLDYFVSGEFLELGGEAADEGEREDVSAQTEAARGRKRPKPVTSGERTLLAAESLASTPVVTPAPNASAAPLRGQAFYSERLVLLPDNGIHYERISMPDPSALCQCGRFRLPEPPGCPVGAATTGLSAGGPSSGGSTPLAGSATTRLHGLNEAALEASGLDPYAQLVPNMRYMDALRPLPTGAKAVAMRLRLNATTTASTPPASAASGVLSISSSGGSAFVTKAGASVGQATPELRLQTPRSLSVTATAAVDGADAAQQGSAHAEGNASSRSPAAAPRPIVFGCPQSLYKLRAEFDAVLARILRAVPHSLLVMVTERRDMHTRQYQGRIKRTMLAPACAAIVAACDAEAEAAAAASSRSSGGAGGVGWTSAPPSDSSSSSSEPARAGSLYDAPHAKVRGAAAARLAPGFHCPRLPDSCVEEVEALTARIRWVPRQSGSDAYFSLLSCADVLLHPFPFDGSKTAADGVAIALPMVTLPTNQLRGRMGYALYRTLGLHGELVARDDDHYVALAVRLATEEAFRHAVVGRLRQRRYTIFDQPHAYSPLHATKRLVQDVQALQRGQHTGWAVESTIPTTLEDEAAGASLARREWREGVSAAASSRHSLPPSGPHTLIAGWESFFVQAAVEQANRYAVRTQEAAGAAATAARAAGAGATAGTPLRRLRP
jgi:hypothetical protein